MATLSRETKRKTDVENGGWNAVVVVSLTVA
jgi:hypothetical protein